MFYANDIFQGTIRPMPLSRPRVGFGLYAPQANLHLHSELPMRFLTEPDDPNRRNDEWNSDDAVNATLGDLYTFPLVNNNGSLTPPNISISEFRITNKESVVNGHAGLVMGLAGNNAYLATAEKHRFDIKNQVSCITLEEKNIRFMDRFNYHFQTQTPIVGFNVTAPYNENGLAVRGNQSDASSTFSVINTNDGIALAIRQSTQDPFNLPVSRFVVFANGRTGIGTDQPGGLYMLDVAGKVRACEVRVSNPGWCDFVFDDNYRLPPLREVEAYIRQHKHLPLIPSEAEVEAEGFDLAQMNALLLRKTEELTLYVIQLEKDLAQARQQADTAQCNQQELQQRMTAMENSLQTLLQLLSTLTPKQP